MIVYLYKGNEQRDDGWQRWMEEENILCRTQLTGLKADDVNDQIKCPYFNLIETVYIYIICIVIGTCM